jgi:drug/metabolite transporter (DMT)-like permease
MVLGSVVANCFHLIWQVDGMITRESFEQLLIVVLFGTAIAYLIYLSNLKFISASLASILTTFESILATVLSVLFFHLMFSWLEIIGFNCVVGSILFLQKRV